MTILHHVRRLVHSKPALEAPPARWIEENTPIGLAVPRTVLEAHQLGSNLAWEGLPLTIPPGLAADLVQWVRDGYHYGTQERLDAERNGEGPYGTLSPLDVDDEDLIDQLAEEAGEPIYRAPAAPADDLPAWCRPAPAPTVEDVAADLRRIATEFSTRYSPAAGFVVKALESLAGDVLIFRTADFATLAARDYEAAVAALQCRECGGRVA